MSIKKIIIIFLIIIFSASMGYAFRFKSPSKITSFDDGALLVINEALQQLWDLSNGKFNLDVKSSVPAWIGEEGDIVAYRSGTTYRLYVYLNGGWRSFSSD